MKLDCVRPRHRKLSPDGRWTDMEFESAAEMEKLDLSEEGGISRKWLQTLVLVLPMFRLLTLRKEYFLMKI